MGSKNRPSAEALATLRRGKSALRARRLALPLRLGSNPDFIALMERR